MNSDLERNLGEQPIARLMAEHNLKTGDLAEASAEFVAYRKAMLALVGEADGKAFAIAK